MGSKEYWDLVYTAARSLVTSYGTHWADVEERTDEPLRRVGWGSHSNNSEWHLAILKHGTAVNPEGAQRNISWWGVDPTDQKQVAKATAWLTMLHDVETAAEKLAANIPTD